MTDENQKKQPPPGDPLDLDLILMVQRGRMHHDAGARPSQANTGYWIEAKPAKSSTEPTSNAGQWILHTTIENVDALWAKISAATEAGTLGYKSRVSTASPVRGKPSQRVILVCTYDASDSADIERVHLALNALGISPYLVGAITYGHVKQ